MAAMWITAAVMAAAVGLVVIAAAMWWRASRHRGARPLRPLTASTDRYRLSRADRAAWKRAEAFWTSPAGWLDRHDIPNN